MPHIHKRFCRMNKQGSQKIKDKIFSVNFQQQLRGSIYFLSCRYELKHAIVTFLSDCLISGCLVSLFVVVGYWVFTS